MKVRPKNEFDSFGFPALPSGGLQCQCAGAGVELNDCRLGEEYRHSTPEGLIQTSGGC